MREIKFRAWDGNKFHYYNSLSGFYGVLNPIEQQFTGLHDKNGKEIYEGDILNVCNGSINGELWMHKPYEVKWVANKGWDICLFCWDENGSNDMDYTHWCEVIGNIYENPELLNQNI